MSALSQQVREEMRKVGNQRGRCALQLDVVILAGTHRILLLVESRARVEGVVVRVRVRVRVRKHARVRRGWGDAST
jgi:hypothetical protein